MAKFVEVVVSVCLFSVLASSVVLAQPDQLVDPMRPRYYEGTPSAPTVKSEEPPQTPTWKLSAVLLAVDRRVAVINGKSLQLGDRLEGYQLIEIFPDRVLLQKNKTKVLLRRSGTGLRKDVH